MITLRQKNFSILKTKRIYPVKLKIYFCNNERIQFKTKLKMLEKRSQFVTYFYIHTKWGVFVLFVQFGAVQIFINRGLVISDFFMISIDFFILPFYKWLCYVVIIKTHYGNDSRNAIIQRTHKSNASAVFVYFILHNLLIIIISKAFFQALHILQVLLLTVFHWQ